MSRFPEVICPRCGANLVVQSDSANCPAGHTFPIVLGHILDLAPDINNKSALVGRLLAAFDSTTYNELGDIVFQEATDIAEDVLKTYRKYNASGIERSRRMTQMFLGQVSKYFRQSEKKAAIEIGCGRGSNLVILSSLFQYVVGLDVNLIGLVLSKKLLDEQGIDNVLLIHSRGEAIPFPDHSFDYATAVNVLEHVSDVDAFVGEANRILSAGGVFAADSRNRYDLFFPEPHVRLRFVGFLPRRWAKAYVRWRKGMDYSDVQLLSWFDLSRVFNRYYGNRHKIVCPQVSAYGFSPQIDTWVERLERWPLLSPVMRLVFPSLLVVAQK
jgi:ubiquinone/menaquinone biosynthesis C-methylase UbiE